MSRASSGFTIVEVLVTLLVAGVFLTGAYQAYGLVTASSAETRNRAEASNLAYEMLRIKQQTIGSPCTPQTLTEAIPATSSLPDPKQYLISVSCPFGTTNSISLVNVTVQYGTSIEEVTHAGYTE